MFQNLSSPTARFTNVLRLINIPRAAWQVLCFNACTHRSSLTPPPLSTAPVERSITNRGPSRPPHLITMWHHGSKQLAHTHHSPHLFPTRVSTQQASKLKGGVQQVRTCYSFPRSLARQWASSSTSRLHAQMWSSNRRMVTAQATQPRTTPTASTMRTRQFHRASRTRPAQSSAMQQQSRS